MKHVKSLLSRLLYFLRLTDDDGLLSITHIACIIVLVKIALNPNPSIIDMGSLLVTLSLYYGKQHLNKSKQGITDENKQAIEDIKVQVQGIKDKTAGMAARIGLTAPTIIGGK